MGLRRRLLTVGLVTAAAAIAAIGQTAPISRTVPVTFTGVVADTVSDSIQIRQPDGSLVAYTGPVPDYPYQKGETVTISFDASLPTRDYFDSGVYQGQVAADGIYRFRVSTQPNSSLIGNIGQATASNVSGPITAAANFGEPALSAMTIVYDYNTDGYSIEGSGNYRSGLFWGGGFAFDAITGLLSACSTTDCGPSFANVGFDLIGDPTGSVVSTLNAPIFATVGSAETELGSRAGFFNLSFTGSWNLPQFGGAISVPEPGMVLLFALAVGVLIGRRKVVQPG